MTRGVATRGTAFRRISPPLIFQPPSTTNLGVSTQSAGNGIHLQPCDGNMRKGEAQLRRVPGATIPYILVHLLIEGCLDVAVQRTVTRNALQRRCVEVRDIILELAQGQLRRMHVPWRPPGNPGTAPARMKPCPSADGRPTSCTPAASHISCAPGGAARAARTQKPPQP